MTDMPEIHLSNTPGASWSLDDDFAVDSDSESDTDDLGGWTVLGQQQAPAITTTAQALQHKLKSRGSPDELRHRGILRERRDDYVEGKCPGTSLSNLTGDSFDKKAKLSKTTKTTKVWLKREITRMLIQEIASKSAGRSGVGRGRGAVVTARPELPKGNNYFVGCGPGVQCKGTKTAAKNGGNYFVGSGPSIAKKARTSPRRGCREYVAKSSRVPRGRNYTAAKTSGNYFPGACPGVALKNGPSKKQHATRAPSASDCAYRKAYSTMLLHKAQADPKSRADEARAALSSLRGVNRPQLKYRATKLARQLSRDRVGRQLERARHSRARGYKQQAQAQAFADDMAEKVRAGWTGVHAGASTNNGVGKNRNTNDRSQSLREAHVVEDAVKYAHKRIRSWSIGSDENLDDSNSTTTSRDDRMRQEFAATAATQRAYRQARILGLWHVKGSGTGINIEAEKAVTSPREEMIRQEFATTQKIITVHKHIREIGRNSKGSGTGIIVESQKAVTLSREEMIRQEFATTQKIITVHKHIREIGRNSKGSGMGIAIEAESNKQAASRDDLLREDFLQAAAAKSAAALDMQRQVARTAVTTTTAVSVPAPAPITLEFELELASEEGNTNTIVTRKGKRKKKKRRKSKTNTNSNKSTSSTNSGAGVTYAGQQASKNKAKAAVVISAEAADAWVREGYASRGDRQLSRWL